MRKTSRPARSRRSQVMLLAGLLALLDCLAPSRAGAVAFYVESGLGTAKFRSGQSFFAPSGTSSTGYGMAFDLGFFTALSDGETPLELHVGIQPRYSTASQGSSFSLLSAYPVARLQVSRISFAAGATSLVWKRVAAGAGFDDFDRVYSSLAYFGEVAALWPVTPDFTLGLAGAAQYVSRGGVVSPSPILDITMIMRFYVGYTGRGTAGSGGASSRSSNEFKGWRYPFGEIR
ncbi:MAG: hypothetical protein NDJ90_09790 [Oligoflexia bacterium]|nr:hypothetical protein [Oligoflexia bacterium]